MNPPPLYADFQQVGQAGARLGLCAPGQVFWGQVEYERHVHQVHRGAGLQDGTEYVRADQERFVLPQAAGPLREMVILAIDGRYSLRGQPTSEPRPAAGMWRDGRLWCVGWTVPVRDNSSAYPTGWFYVSMRAGR